MALLSIQNLHTEAEGKEILRGVNLSLGVGEIHALMGPNGSGKSTLASVLMGHPGYQVTAGSVLFAGQNLLSLEPEERARAGIFLAFQYPVAVPGLSVEHFLRTAVNAQREARQEKPLNIKDFHAHLQQAAERLKVPLPLLERGLNDGFSGGEKKRLEVLQLAVLKPKLAVLDETDSGLDIDALKLVAEGVNTARGKDMGVLVITHYQRLLHYLKPTHVHIVVAGKIVQSAGPELVEKVERDGYRKFVAAYV